MENGPFFALSFRYTTALKDSDALPEYAKSSRMTYCRCSCMRKASDEDFPSSRSGFPSLSRYGERA